METPLASRVGPLERTAIEISFVTRSAKFRRSQTDPRRRTLRRSDLLLGLVEETIEQKMRLVPTPIWMATARLVGEVDPTLRDGLGIDRRPNHVASVLMKAQGQLMRATRRVTPQLAPIIPLFPQRQK